MSYSVRRESRKDPSKGYYQCPICNDYFRQLGTLKWHTKRIHQNQSRGECITCDRGFETGYYLRKHIRTCHNEWERVNVRCTDCKQEFISVERLMKHSRVHSPLLFNCRICSKPFSHNQNRLRHESTHGSVANQFTCPHCFKSFVQVGNLTIHINCFHPGNQSVRYKCPYCAKALRSKPDYTEHLGKHSLKKKLLKCTFCIKTFPTTKLCDEHCTRVHGKENFKCPICRDEFSDPVVGVGHVKTHEEVRDREYACKYCDGYFDNIPTLIRHRIKDHPLEVKLDGTLAKVPRGFMELVTCSACGHVSLTRKKHLRHVRTCEKANANAANKMGVQHCCQCGLELSSFSELLKHAETHEEVSLPQDILSRDETNKETKAETQLIPENGNCSEEILQCGWCNSEWAEWQSFSEHLKTCPSSPAPDANFDLKQIPDDKHSRMLKKSVAMDAYVTRIFGPRKRKMPDEYQQGLGMKTSPFIWPSEGPSGCMNKSRCSQICASNSQNKSDIEKPMNCEGFSVSFFDKETCIRNDSYSFDPWSKRDITCAKCVHLLSSEVEAYNHASRHCEKEGTVLYVVRFSRGFKVVDKDYLRGLAMGFCTGTLDVKSRAKKLRIEKGTSERKADREINPYLVIAVSLVEPSLADGTLDNLGDEYPNINAHSEIQFRSIEGELFCERCQMKVLDGKMLEHASTHHFSCTGQERKVQLILIYRQNCGFSVISDVSGRKFGVQDLPETRAEDSQSENVECDKVETAMTEVAELHVREKYKQLDQSLAFPPSRNSDYEGFRLNFVKISKEILPNMEQEICEVESVWCTKCFRRLAQDEIGEHLYKHNKNDDLYLEENEYACSAYNEKARLFDEQRKEENLVTKKDRQEMTKIICQLTNDLWNVNNWDEGVEGINGKNKQVKSYENNVRGLNVADSEQPDTRQNSGENSDSKDLEQVMQTMFCIDNLPVIKLVDGNIVIKPKYDCSSNVDNLPRRGRGRPKSSSYVYSQKTAKEYLNLEIADEEKLAHTCHVCRQEYGDFTQFIEHVEREHHMQNSETIFYCDQCPKFFEREGYLKKHLQLVHHKVDGLPPCPICRAVFVKMSDLGRHMTLHKIDMAGDVSTVEGTVNAEGKVPSALSSRVLREKIKAANSPTTPGGSPVNSSEFSTNSNEVAVDNVVIDTTNDGTVFQCSECEFCYDTFEEAMRHINDVHEGDLLVEIDNAATDFIAEMPVNDQIDLAESTEQFSSETELGIDASVSVLCPNVGNTNSDSINDEIDSENSNLKSWKRVTVDNENDTQKVPFGETTLSSSSSENVLNMQNITADIGAVATEVVGEQFDAVTVNEEERHLDEAAVNEVLHAPSGTEGEQSEDEEAFSIIRASDDMTEVMAETANSNDVADENQLALCGGEDSSTRHCQRVTTYLEISGQETDVRTLLATIHRIAGTNLSNCLQIRECHLV